MRHTRTRTLTLAIGSFMKPKRRRIQLDRGDTLGGTVPLLMQGDVTASALSGRSLRRESREGGGFLRAVRRLLLLIGIAAVLIWVFVPEDASWEDVPSLPDIWSGFLALF
jgi:hypothetical protein